MTEEDRMRDRGTPQERCFGLLDVDENTAAELMTEYPNVFRELGK